MKRIFVTGGNKGIGLATVAKLLKSYDDTHLILGSRNKERGEEAVGSLIRENRDWKERLVTVEIDVESEDSVKEAADKLSSMFGTAPSPLYGIVNNAGIGSTAKGMERTLQVNTWGIKRVCDSFIPLLNPEIGRIVNVTSAAGPNYIEAGDESTRELLTNPQVTWEEVVEYMNRCIEKESRDETKSSSQANAYGLSKACANALTVCLARDYPDLIINSCTPGFIETDMTRPFADAQGKTPQEMGMKTPEDGASASVFLIMEDVPGSGMYFGSDCQRSPIDRYRSPGDPPYNG